MHDLERIGLFKEMPYVTIGTPYTPPITTLANFAGKNLYVSGTKLPCANNDGYFAEFKRIFDGEGGLTNFVQLRRRWQMAKNGKIIGKPWQPSSGDRKRSGVGSYLGCIYEKIPAFGSLTKTYPYVAPKKNFLTNPSKKGTGYGYLDICINKYPEYIMGNKYSDFKTLYQKYDEEHILKVAGRPPFLPSKGCGGYFDVNPFAGGSTQLKPLKELDSLEKPFIPSSYPKKDGGCKAGTLNPFPTYGHDTYNDQQLNLFKDYVNDQGKKLLPNNTFPTYFPHSSILKKNVEFRCNNTNIGNVDRVMNY